MKRIALFLLCAVLAIGSAAQPAEIVQTFDRGTSALLDGRFSEALDAFHSVETAGWGSGALFYNMGMTYYRMDRLGEAIQYLEKARKLEADDPRIQHSLSVAERRRTDRFSQLPDPFWRTAQSWMTGVIPIRWAFGLGMLAWLGFGGLWTWQLTTGIRTPWIRRIRQASLLMGCLLLVHALASSISPAEPPRSVILDPVVTLREQATEQANDVLTVHEGLVVDVRSEAGEWALVEVPNGTRGWIPSRSLGTI
ncbi:MAG: tetratricopeptide repeat protein [Bacteroidetes bacterium]|nr:tetratricopeptide repeat protein [Bacteroidota bacterium]MDA0874927.1 tetratricopeptide repeat protein [Bacteroidota bacterium]